MASVIKRGNKYYAAFRLGGKQVRVATGIDVFPGGRVGKNPPREQKAKADLIAEELEKSARGGKVDVERVKVLVGERRGRDLLGGRRCMPSVEEYLEQWCFSREKRRTEKDRYVVRLFVESLGRDKGMPLDMVTRGHVRHFVEGQLERVACGTVKLYVSVLRVALNHAVQADLIAVNPFAGIHVGMEEKQERKAFSVAEVRRLLEVLPGEWPDMVRVCLYTGGQRLGDIARLTWSQIDIEGGLIAITTQKTKRRMNKPIIEPLRACLSRLSACRVSEYVFPLAAMRYAQAGGKVSKLSLEFTGLLKEYGFVDGGEVLLRGDRRKLSELSFHSLRATAVTVLRNAGVPADLCRFIVGHDSEEIERVYFRPDGEAVKAAMLPLERIEV